MVLLGSEPSGRRWLGALESLQDAPFPNLGHLHLNDARQRCEGSGLEKLLLKPAKLKALVFGAGLLYLGVKTAFAEPIGAPCR